MFCCLQIVCREHFFYKYFYIRLAPNDYLAKEKQMDIKVIHLCLFFKKDEARNSKKRKTCSTLWQDEATLFYPKAIV